MNIELKGDNFELSFKYKPSIIDRIRQIPGRRLTVPEKFGLFRLGVELILKG